jgi:hypothetical protein
MEVENKILPMGRKMFDAQLCVPVTESMKDAVVRIAQKQGVSPVVIIRQALAQFLKEKGEIVSLTLKQNETQDGH